MFNDSEVQLAQTVLQEIKNAAGSGFNYMVQGTIVSNELNLIGLAVTIFATIIVSAYVYSKEPNEKEGAAMGFGFLTFLVIGFLCVLVISCIQGIICPEYVLINSVLNRGC